MMAGFSRAAASAGLGRKLNRLTVTPTKRTMARRFIPLSFAHSIRVDSCKSSRRNRRFKPFCCCGTTGATSQGVGRALRCAPPAPGGENGAVFATCRGAQRGARFSSPSIPWSASEPGRVLDPPDRVPSWHSGAERCASRADLGLNSTDLREYAHFLGQPGGLAVRIGALRPYVRIAAQISTCPGGPAPSVPSTCSGIAPVLLRYHSDVDPDPRQSDTGAIPEQLASNKPAPRWRAGNSRGSAWNRRLARTLERSGR